MHTNNVKFLDEIKAKYPTSFSGVKVLDLGSCDSSFTRKYFDDSTYVGIDLMDDPAGHTVDIIINARDTKFEPEGFDTLLSFSLFEHDPLWDKSFIHNITWLKSGGMGFLCWGAEGNLHHDSGYFPWKIVPHQDFLKVAKTLPIEIIDAFFEWDKYGQDECSGAYDVVFRKK